METERLPTTVPEGFPEQLNGDLVWEGDKLADTYDWTYVLSEDHLAEIDEAVKYFKCRPSLWSYDSPCGPRNPADGALQL